MILRTPFWIAIAAVLGTAQVTGTVNVFTTAASVLTGIDGTVNAVLDFKKWAPQVKTYIKGKKNAATSTRGVLLATKPTIANLGRKGSGKYIVDHRCGNCGGPYPEKTLSIAEQ